MEKQSDKQKNIRLLCERLLEAIASATDGMSVGEYDCGKIYIPSFKYMPSIEFDEVDVETIKQMHREDGNEDAGTLLDWFEDAEEEENE